MDEKKRIFEYQYGEEGIIWRENLGRGHSSSGSTFSQLAPVTQEEADALTIRLAKKPAKRVQ